MPRDGQWRAPKDRIRVYASRGALAGAVVLSVATFAVFLAFASPTEGNTDGLVRLYAGRLSELEVGVPRFYEWADLFVVKHEDGRVSAFHARDTRYNGCGLELRDDITRAGGIDEIGVLRDRCTCNLFNTFGERILGPSPRDLDRLPIHVEGDRIYVTAVKELLIRGSQ